MSLTLSQNPSQASPPHRFSPLPSTATPSLFVAAVATSSVCRRRHRSYLLFLSLLPLSNFESPPSPSPLERLNRFSSPACPPHLPTPKYVVNAPAADDEDTGAQVSRPDKGKGKAGQVGSSPRDWYTGFFDNDDKPLFLVIFGDNEYAADSAFFDDDNKLREDCSVVSIYGDPEDCGVFKKIRDVLAKHSPERCSLEPTKGLEDKELAALAANKDQQRD